MESDILIIGGGIAGASLAFHLADRFSVILIERESSFGVHATGRSAAEWSLVHANGLTRALTEASHDFLAAPPTDFSEYPLLTERGNLIVAREGSELLLDQLLDSSQAFVTGLTRITPAAAAQYVPFVDPSVVSAALYDPTNSAIDVDALLTGFLRGARQQGAVVMNDVSVLRGYRKGHDWAVDTSFGLINTATVVNAAGPWADEVAASFGVTPLGLVPRRRSAIAFDLPGLPDIRSAPSLDDVGTGAYIKPEGGILMASPGDATPSPACDAAPEEIDAATAAWLVEELTGRPVNRINARWAGLRTFAADEQPVAGWDGAMPGFFWFAGLGGAGLMMSPALGESAAAIIKGGEVSPKLQQRGISAQALSPCRLVKDECDQKNSETIQ